ncbi:uncharacterized protein LOC119905547 [Micropterus salmoides]|uniref:uncharacterized protein LOC119905547 n=1 Tax=Micropterus salmoides TaxID=27706 RepID=UPI0018ED2012|nr:uncharacterized protein LOC119905547 [Micropterus salmoides]
MKAFANFPLTNISTYVAIIVIFIHNNVLHKKFECTCEGLTGVCWLYMILPCVMLFILQLWIDKRFQRAMAYTFCCVKRCYICCIFLHHIMKAVFIGLLWAVSVLIDGEWYVCCWNDQSEEQKQLACNGNRWYGGEHKTIAELKDKSWVFGMILIGSALLLASITSACGWMHCCDRNIGFSKIILDEEKNVMKKILIKAAQQKLTEKIREKRDSNGRWEDCFDVAKELIEKGTAPEFPESADEEHYRFTTLVQTAAATAGATAGLTRSEKTDAAVETAVAAIEAVNQQLPEEDTKKLVTAVAKEINSAADKTVARAAAGAATGAAAGAAAAKEAARTLR